MRKTKGLLVLSLSWLLLGCGGGSPRTSEQEPFERQVIACGSVDLEQATHDQCEAMDAAPASDGGSHCFCLLGFTWNGSACVGLIDCACEGADCNKLTQTIEACQAQHAACAQPPDVDPDAGCAALGCPGGYWCCHSTWGPVCVADDVGCFI